jgi:hypothetical protein
MFRIGEYGMSSYRAADIVDAMGKEREAMKTSEE